MRFKARGIPRSLLQEFNSLIMWDDSGRPSLHIGDDDWQRVLFYSQLDTIMSEVSALDGTDPSPAVLIDRDRWNLGCYHTADWVLRSRGRAFSAQDVVADGQLDPRLRLDGPSAERLLEHLRSSGVVAVVSEPGRVDATQYGNPAGAGLTYYRLAEAYSRSVAGFARRHEGERADLGTPVPTYLSADASTTVEIRLRPGGVADTDRTPSPPPSRLHSLPPITRLADRYEVRQLIGAGGMGGVYRGRDLHTGEEVAIKLLHPALAEDGLIRARFRREGDIGIRVRHPNVVRIITSFDLPEPAIVMELAEGPSLDQLLERHGSLPPSDVAWIGRVLGEALEYLHSLQMSRIDLKPANVIVTRDRGPLIVDLGLVRPKDTSESITGVGSVMGTIPYMAPEQIRDAKAADIRSDVYALGAVLYQCITGRRLYNGDNPVEVVFAILREPATLGDLPVSPLLNDVLHTCLARDPADRYQDPSRFLQALARTPESGQEPTLRLTGP
ncbi:serine/threonine protein kinase [Streptomyces arenae]|nr:serine/threonine protein kinase [Streptomyces arenae]